MADAALAYDAAGEGDLVLLLHGFPLTRALWSPVLPALARGRRVVAPDLRGFGASPSPGPSLMEDYARDVLALADAQGAPAFDLVAHSMGGYVAFALLRAAPARVRRLVLVATKATPDSDEARAARARHQDLAQSKGVGALADLLVPKMIAPTTPRLVVEEARRLAESNRVSGVVVALDAMARRPDSTPLLPAVPARTLVVAGAQDGLMPRAEQDRMAREIPGARLEVLERSGHLPMMEEPERFAEIVGGFLAEK